MWSEVIGAGIEAIGGSLSGLPYVVETDADRLNEKRLKELQRKAELGALGLTEEERQAYFNVLSRPAQGARRDLLQGAQQSNLAFSSTGAGDILKQEALMREAQARTESDIGAQVLQEDIMQAQAERQELEDRTAYKAKREQQKAQVAMSFFMPLLVSAGEIGQQALTTGGMGGPKKKTKGTELSERGQKYADEVLSEFDDLPEAP